MIGHCGPGGPCGVGSQGGPGRPGCPNYTGSPGGLGGPGGPGGSGGQGGPGDPGDPGDPGYQCGPGEKRTQTSVWVSSRGLLQAIRETKVLMWYIALPVCPMPHFSHMLLLMYCHQLLLYIRDKSDDWDYNWSGHPCTRRQT